MSDDLRKLRMESGKSISEFSLLLGIKKTELMDLEHGRKFPSEALLEKLEVIKNSQTRKQT